MAYLEAVHGPEEGCFLCHAAEHVDADAPVWVLARGAATFVLLNAYPYNPGHLMIAPTRHVADLEALEDAELSQAYTRAYNRWICEFCADSDRLIPTAHLSLSDPTAAARELGLDRNRDGVLTPDDFDWSNRSPFLREAGMARLVFGRMDSNSNQSGARDLAAAF